MKESRSSVAWSAQCTSSSTITTGCFGAERTRRNASNTAAAPLPWSSSLASSPPTTAAISASGPSGRGVASGSQAPSRTRAAAALVSEKSRTTAVLPTPASPLTSASRPPPSPTSFSSSERSARTASRSTTSVSLLPFNRAWRLRRQVERHAVHGRDLVDDPAGDRLQQVIREACPVGGHGVVGRDRPDHDRVRVGALVALDPDRPDRRQHGEALPELAVEPGAA